MVDPAKMCRRHLLGEHNEIHMLIGSISRKKNLSGFLKNHLIEPLSVKTRHDELAEEMIRRGYSHKSPIDSIPDLEYLGKSSRTKVDSEKNYRELVNRCEICRLIAENN